ncbi:antibiotic biosynthesis monooxygenase [Acidisoma cellulosilytica]|uniref:Antibiotic biosynthesis monooxygenase n=1 Tax=Acidisoma cellulosilyticum TaxID=2802395 RepID=A0A963YYI7_9PROT|nr:putative quinol monooxygenase [Acidisoma cellulosilyticum]MCB8879613.1 antibiotic biosynthesis monooxygenase [Acidisoma cellulosilyticum]
MPKALYATFEVLPGQEETLRQMMADLTQAVRAEPGCLRFVAYTRADNPLAFHVDEIYADDAAFAAHIGSAHGRAFNAAIADKVVGGGSTVYFLDATER